jgi:hypothetical protein
VGVGGDVLLRADEHAALAQRRGVAGVVVFRDRRAGELRREVLDRADGDELELLAPAADALEREVQPVHVGVARLDEDPPLVPLRRRRRR